MIKCVCVCHFSHAQKYWSSKRTVWFGESYVDTRGRTCQDGVSGTAPRRWEGLSAPSRGAVSTARTPQFLPKRPPTHRNGSGFNTRTLAEIMKKKRAFSSVFHTKFFLVEISKNKYVSSTFFLIFSHG